MRRPRRLGSPRFIVALGYERERLGGCRSKLTSTRVRCGASSCEVIAPVCEMSSVTFHSIHSAGPLAGPLILKFLVQVHVQTLKLRWLSPSCDTDGTRRVKSGLSSSWVDWL